MTFYYRPLVLGVVGIMTGGLVGCAMIMPKAAPMSMPPKPQLQSAELIVEVTADDAAVTDFVQPKNHTFARNASVVINVPSDINNTQRDDGQDSTGFQTRNYYSAAEERIERELIRHGFRLLSRAKFEAKLREQRDASDVCTPWYRCPDRLDPDLRAAVEDLDKDLESGAVTRVQYVEAMSDLNRSKLRSAGRTRQENENELVDMSEVIRAAQSGPESERADYILEINRFKTDPRDTIERTVDLTRHPDMSRFRNAHPWAEPATRHESLRLRCEQQSAELNAKLVEVSSGQVVWIGSHRLTESMLDQEDSSMLFKLEVSQRITNEAQVQRFVLAMNTEEALRERAGEQPPSAPAYETTLVLNGPDLLRGECMAPKRSIEQKDAVSTALAQQVAETLIKTIRVGGF